MGKINSGKAAQTGTKIPPSPLPKTDEALLFSFRHLDILTNEKFCLTRCKEGYFQKFFERLKALHGFTVKELQENKSKSLRCHTLDWKGTSEPDGFTCLNEQLRSIQAWQFEVSKVEHGRVHGFFIDRTFFVIWIDPDHLMYS